MGHQALLPILENLFPSCMQALSFSSKYWDGHLHPSIFSAVTRNATKVKNPFLLLAHLGVSHLLPKVPACLAGNPL